MAIRSYKGVTPSFNSSVYVDESSVLVGDITIGDHCSVWPLVAARGDVNYIRIGERTNIQDGSVLHLSRATKSNPDDVIIGGGSLVPPNKRLESGYLYVGSPVKQARPLTEQELAFLKVSADNYVQLKDEYLAEIN